MGSRRWVSSVERMREDGCIGEIALGETSNFEPSQNGAFFHPSSFSLHPSFFLAIYLLTPVTHDGGYGTIFLFPARNVRDLGITNPWYGPSA